MLAYGLIAGWRLDENVGNSRADVLGVASMLESGGTVLATPGKVGQGVNLSANAHFLQYSGVIIPSGSFSMAAWTNWTSGGTTNVVLWQSAGASLRQGLVINAGTGIPVFTANGANNFNDGVAKPGSWTHLALSYDADNTLLATYQDGVQVNTHVTTANFTGISLTMIGGSTSNLKVDEAYIWGRVKGPAEIAQLYAVGNAGLSYPWTDGKSIM